MLTFLRFAEAFKSQGYTGLYFPHGEIEVNLISPLLVNLISHDSGNTQY